MSCPHEYHEYFKIDEKKNAGSINDERDVPLFCRQSVILRNPNKACSVVRELIDKYVVVSLAAEGENIGPYGKLSIVQIATCDGMCYIFDVLCCPDLMEHGGLKELLESLDVIKIINDSRGVSAVLYGKFKVLLSNVFDTQCAHAVIQSQVNCCSAYDVPIVSLRYICKQYACGLNSSANFIAKKNNISEYARWMCRPLPQSIISIAASRALCLIPEIYNNMNKLISARNWSIFQKMTHLNVIYHIYPEKHEKEMRQRMQRKYKQILAKKQTSRTCSRAGSENVEKKSVKKHDARGDNGIRCLGCKHYKHKYEKEHELKSVTSLASLLKKRKKGINDYDYRPKKKLCKDKKVGFGRANCDDVNGSSELSCVSSDTVGEWLDYLNVAKDLEIMPTSNCKRKLQESTTINENRHTNQSRNTNRSRNTNQSRNTNRSRNTNQSRNTNLSGKRDEQSLEKLLRKYKLNRCREDCKCDHFWRKLFLKDNERHLRHRSITSSPNVLKCKNHRCCKNNDNDFSSSSSLDSLYQMACDCDRNFVRNNLIDTSKLKKNSKDREYYSTLKTTLSQCSPRSKEVKKCFKKEENTGVTCNCIDCWLLGTNPCDMEEEKCPIENKFVCDDKVHQEKKYVVTGGQESTIKICNCGNCKQKALKCSCQESSCKCNCEKKNENQN